MRALCTALGWVPVDLRLGVEGDGGETGCCGRDRRGCGKTRVPGSQLHTLWRNPRPRPPARELTAAGPDTLRQGRWDLLGLAGPPEAWTLRLPVRGWACPHRKDAPGLTDPHLARALHGDSGDLLKGCEGEGGHTQNETLGAAFLLVPKHLWVWVKGAPEPPTPAFTVTRCAEVRNGDML